MPRRGDRIFTRIYPTKVADPRSVWTIKDAEFFRDNFEDFRPFYLRREHDKTDDGIVGEVLDFQVDVRDGWTAGNCIVHDKDELEKIQRGEIDSVSFSFTETSSHLNPGEISLVNKPFFKGAKILCNYNDQGQREIIVPVKDSTEFFRGYREHVKMEQQQQQQETSSATPVEFAQEIMNSDVNTTDLPDNNEQMLRHTMSVEQRARFDALPPNEKAAFVGKAMRELDEKNARLQELEARENQRQRAEMEARLNQARPLVEKISARTMNKNLSEKEAEAAKLAMAKYLTSEGGQWAAKAWSGMIEDSERNQQKLEALQKQVAHLTDITQRSQAAQQAGIKYPFQQQPVQHAYNAELGAKTVPQQMSNSFDRLFGDFCSSASTTTTSSSSVNAAASSSFSEQPVEHNYSQQGRRGFKRDANGTNKAQSIPRTAYSARVASKLMIEGPIAPEKEGRMDEQEVVHNYSMELGQTINSGAKKDPEQLMSDIITNNLANATREQFAIRRGRPSVWQESWAKTQPAAFDELVAAVNNRDGPPPTNAGAGLVGIKEWKQMSAHERRARPDLAFMDAPGFENTYMFKLDTTSRHAKRQRRRN